MLLSKQIILLYLLITMQLKQFEIWIDINLPRTLKYFLIDKFNLPAKTFYELGFISTNDEEIWKLANQNTNVIIITSKDFDFVDLVLQTNTKTKVIHINTGNISNTTLKKIAEKYFMDCLNILLDTNQKVIELIDKEKIKPNYE